MRLQRLHRQGRDVLHRAAQLGRESAQEVAGQQRDVGAPLAQRRRPELHDIEPVEEVFTELPLLDGFDNVAVGCRDQTHLDPQFLGSAHAGERPVLQETQQLGLKRSAHVTDLVQEDRATIRLLDVPALGPMRSRESTTLIAKEFGLQERLWDGRAVQPDVRSRCSVTVEVNGPSDHASFYLENIPVVHFFSGQHEDYHKPSDDEALINYQGMANSLSVLEQLIVLNNKKGKLPFTKTQDAQMGRTKFKITLGVMPDYSFNGKGMRIDGVSEGKPAQKAGLQKGDIIQKLGDFDVNGVEDYMVGLGKLTADKPTTVIVLRGAETLTFPIQFQ